VAASAFLQQGHSTVKMPLFVDAGAESGGSPEVEALTLPLLSIRFP